MRGAFLALLLLLLASSLISAASPDTLWTRTLEGSYSESAWYVEETSDYGYVITGYTDSTAQGEGGIYRDIYIVKLDQYGGFAWEKTYGEEANDEVAGSAKETRDGGLIVAGYAYDQFGAESANFYLMKLDALGNFLWDNDYDFNNAGDAGTDACQTLNGGYIIVGTSIYYSTSQGMYDWGANIVRTNSYGAEQNHILVDKPGDQHLNRVVPTADSGAIAVGIAAGMYIVKIDKYGDTTWTKEYGGVGEGWSILQLADGGYVAFGDRTFSAPEMKDFWLIRLNSAGDILWTRRYRNAESDLGYGLDQTRDGGFIMAGELHPGADVDRTDLYIIRTNSNGDTLWTKTIGGERNEHAYCVKQASDGGYIIAGTTDFYGNDPDFYIVKLAADNATGVTDDRESLPLSFTLGANYPNPFNPLTTIEYSVPSRAHVSIEVFDVLGRKVRTLVDEPRSAGSHRVVWNGCDNAGQPVSTGLYLYRLKADDLVQTRKMMLLK